jgi:hypothetical protein
MNSIENNATTAVITANQSVEVSIIENKSDQVSSSNFKTQRRFLFLTFLLVVFYSFTVFGATYYIDPSYSGYTQNGSMSNPYNSWKKFTINSGNTYLQKAGTTYNTNSTITISGKSNVIIGAYGTGAKPKIVASGTGSHIINVTSSSNVTVKDIEVFTSGKWTTAIIIQGNNAANNTIDNTVLRKTEWGVRVITSASGNKILRSTINDILDDGVYIKDASTIEIGFCTIYDVNKKYLVNTDQAYSSGDGIQIASTNNLNFNIHDNIIDHSSMGNKFAIIAYGNNYSGVIERNTIIGNASKVVSGIYLHPTSKTVTIRYNHIKNSNYGIYNYSKADVYYNIFSNNKTAVHTMSGYTLNARNNVFYNNTATAVSSSSNTSTTLRNNIFNISGSGKAIKTSGSVSSNNNMFNTQTSGFINNYATLAAWRSASGNDKASLVGNPGFVNPGNQDFKVVSTSQAINKGVNVSLVKDYFGNTVPSSGAPDIGIHEFRTGKSGEEIAFSDSLTGEKQMLVYPNPSTNGKFAVALGKTVEKADFEIFDMAGRLVKTATVVQTAEGHLDMSTMPDGAYLIRVSAGHENKVLKAIKAVQ